MPRTVLTTTFDVLLAGKRVSDAEIAGWVVEQDVNQPDMCVVTLHNAEHSHSNEIELGDSLDVDVVEERERVRIFAGEVVGLEPRYEAGGQSLCVVRAFNRLHRLLRGRHSRTFVDQTDRQIAQRIASENNLGDTCDDTATTYEHVYQHNQTDFEFLRGRAARIGFEVMVEDRTLHFRKPRRDVDSGLELRLNEPDAEMPMLSFAPRMSSAGLVDKVEVRGWDPGKKEEIVAICEGSRSPLGETAGYERARRAFGTRVTYQVDLPVASVAEAEEIARAHFDELAMDYITGDALCLGTPKLKAGIVVTLIVNPNRRQDRFNGKYRIAGASHRYAHARSGGSKGGYTTALRVRRDAEGAR